MFEQLRTHAGRLVAISATVLLYIAARVPSPSRNDRTEIARGFRFTTSSLPTLGETRRSERRVRKSLEPIAAWISSVGAAVALNDLDGDGFPNDICYVDVRSDSVVTAPVPGSVKRYPPFNLLQSPGCSGHPTAAPMGAVPADINEDGLLDVLVYFWARSPLLFVQHRAGPLGPASFTCEELLGRSEEWYTNAAVFSDVDGDGHPDLVIGNYFREHAGVLDPASRATEMQMQDSMSHALNAGLNELLLWQEDAPRPSGVSFRRISGAFPPEVSRGWTLAIGAQDLDGDLLPELYFANDFGPDRLLHNESARGHPRFSLVSGHRGLFDPKSKVLGNDSFKGMGVDFTDLNGDGIPDIFVSNITEPYGLEESNFAFVSESRSLVYLDRSEELGLARSGWGWDAKFGDFDNRGPPELLQATGFVRGKVNRWPELQELAMANDALLHFEGLWPRFGSGTDLSGNDHNPFFVRWHDGRYYDVSEEIGLAEPMVSRGIATADVDGDGRLDFAVANQWGPSKFFHNESLEVGHFLLLYVRFPVTPSSATTVMAGPPPQLIRSYAAIGARADAYIVEGDTQRRASGQIDGGNGHSGKRSHEIHFGLGRAQDAEVIVSWRDPLGRVGRQRLRMKAGVYTVMLGKGSA